MTGRSILGAWLILLVGCSSSNPSGDRCPDPAADGGIAVDDYCPTFADILAEGLASCCEIDDVEPYRARVLGECEAGEISSIRAGISCLDGPIARRCLDAWRDDLADCVYDSDLDSACRFQWYGFAEAGESCRDVWHCRPGLACLLRGTEGTCVELPGEGESCGVSTACRPEGLYCSYEDWLCHRKPAIGDRCERSGICEVGVCQGGTCQEISWFRCGD